VSFGHRFLFTEAVFAKKTGKNIKNNYFQKKKIENLGIGEIKRI
jgi:hypothetical protein